MPDNNSELEEIRRNSGNSFHIKVVNELRRLGWNVDISTYYSDNYSDKPRELDIIARKKINKNNAHFGGSIIIEVVLIIECKYIKDKTIFWFDAVNKEQCIKRIEKDLKLPQDGWSIFTSHHYQKPQDVAKLWQSNLSKNEDNEAIYKAVNQVLNGLVYFRNNFEYSTNTIHNRIFYPIILVNTFENFFRIENNDEVKVNPIDSSFIIELNYAYLNGEHKSTSEYFLIDTVSFDKLDDFLKDIDSETDCLIRSYQFQKNQNSKQN